MKKKFLTLSFMLLCACASRVHAQEIAIIANSSITESTIDLAALSNIFVLSKVSWSNGMQIQLADMTDGGARDKVYAAINRQPVDVKKIWIRKKLADGTETPKNFHSTEDVAKFVAATAGAIGYVPKDKVPSGVKVLLTIK